MARLRHAAEACRRCVSPALYRLVEGRIGRASLDALAARDSRYFSSAIWRRVSWTPAQGAKPAERNRVLPSSRKTSASGAILY